VVRAASMNCLTAALNATCTAREVPEIDRPAGVRPQLNLRHLVDGLAKEPMKRVASDVLTMRFPSHIPLLWRPELLIAPLWCSDQDRQSK
jgi:hypothetical protein